MQGEVGSNEDGLQAVAGRYLYFCGATPDCQGDTTALLDFLAYYQAWRESNRAPQKPFLSPPLPEQIKIAEAIVSGDSAVLKEYGFTGDIQKRFRTDLPFHFANVSPEWNDLLVQKLGRLPDDPANMFWVLSIDDIQRICGPAWGVDAPDMTSKIIPPECDK